MVDTDSLKDVEYVLFIIASSITMLASKSLLPQDLFAIVILMYLAYNPLYYVTVFSQTHGFSPNITLYILAILNAGAFFGRIIPGMVADKLGL